ncbi:hypothetical protein BC831DRAFT_495143 [Entophlyctis helioformis]|nr:hypothetical protein BC831DRAFT_495143 [Entophlyctis helioformis]
MTSLSAVAVQHAPESAIFHEGEVLLQKLVGFRAEAEYHYVDFIRSSMPNQHRSFFQNLRYVFVTTTSASGEPWSSVLAGPSEFVASPDPEHLVLRFHPAAGDPIADNLAHAAAILQLGRTDDATLQFGFLGIEFHTRRRNRMNGTMTAIGKNGDGSWTVQVRVVQSYGNCPKYIQVREIVGMRAPAKPSSDTLASQESTARLGQGGLTLEMQAMVRQADTVFVGTQYVHDHAPARSSGLDLSHRGGRPGFLQVLNGGKLLVLPDYKGNNMFMTMGNILKDPRASLVIPDFETGACLYITARAQTLVAPESFAYLPGMQRLNLFEPIKAVIVHHALPYLFELRDMSPFNPPVRVSPLAAAPAQTVDGSQATPSTNQATLVSRVRHTDSVSSFTFRVDQPIQYAPGQFATLDFSQYDTALARRKLRAEQTTRDPAIMNDDLVRSWTITSTPPHSADSGFVRTSTFTITVKHYADGMISPVLHSLQPGASPSIPLLGVGGEFSIFCNPDNLGNGTAAKDNVRKVLFVAGGIGVTPFVGMVRGLVEQAQHASHTATAQPTDVVFMLSAPHVDDVPVDLVREMSQLLAPHKISIVIALSRASPSSIKAASDHGGSLQGLGAVVAGRLDKNMLLQHVEDVQQRTVYVCGPSGFQTSVTDMMQSLGVAGEAVHTETFSF